MVPKVFIASSSEGIKIAKAVERLLLHNLGDNAEIAPWPWKFELSATYIESLEKTSGDMDFAVVVLTPDDVTTSRQAKKLTPRDNVVFELGLFIGSIGRQRCFLVYESTHDLKLPTDLLGVKPATFESSPDKNLGRALKPTCSSLCRQIRKLGCRNKIDADALVVNTAINSFISQIIGAWWERIQTGSAVELSFFTIRTTSDRRTLHLRGDHFDGKGVLIGHWKSEEVGIREAQRELFYRWEGEHPPTSAGNASQVQGFGTFEFDHAIGPGGR